MTMGERLRRAREEAGLSQRQVCGDQITRNQLSQLEHDRVGPSVETLRYLAGQLGRPVSYFLDRHASNLLALQEARIRADPGEALRALEGYQPDGSAYDDLAALLESILSPGGIGSGGCRGQTPLCQKLGRPGTGSLDPVRLSGRRPGSGGSLREAELAGGPDFLPAAKAWVRDRETVLLARLSLAQDCPARALALLEGVPDQSLLQGQALYRLGRYQEALELLRCAEVQATPEEAPPIWQLLEACCRESGDYRGAYEYAAKLRPPAGP